MSIKYIALSVGCHRGSLSRELNRNGGQENYCPHPADKAGLARRRHAAKYKIPPERVEFIRLLIEPDWSPEQISGVLKTSGMPVSQEWIYQFIADDKAPGGRLYRHFRQGKRVQAEAIKNVVSIDERAAIVDSREPFGDWEIETVSGPHGTGTMVTLLARKSRFFRIQKVDSKSAKDVTTARIELLMPDKEDVQTITAGKGRQFANHEEIAKALEVEVYFGHPYR